jgi:PIN domain nuclease of toxin-antitoxin system
VVLDTHAAIWYLAGSKELSSAALQAIRQTLGSGTRVQISAISMVEIVYLVEKGRIPGEALDRLSAALGDANSGLLVAPVDGTVAETVQRISRNVVPDMPDRIIAATALRLGLPLVTRDQRIRMAGIQTIW